MSVLERFKDIISSNINALLDRCEDPAKLVDEYLLGAMEDLAEVKRDTAAVMAEETRCKRLLDDAAADAAKYENLAMRALQAGNEDDARTLIAHKQECDAKAAAARESYAVAAANADKMRRLHDKLVADIESLRSRRASIRATMAVAEAQAKVNGMTADPDGALEGFERMEERAERMLDEAMAGAELNEDPLESLERKYDAALPSVEDELAAMKARLNAGGNA